MHVELSPEAGHDLLMIKSLALDLGFRIDGVIKILELDAIDFPATDGFSIDRVVALFQRRIPVFRVRDDRQMKDYRILFFRLLRCVYVTGIHWRGHFGDPYDMLKEPFVRAQRYWGMRRTLCLS
jgi:hypothetical protein